VGLPLARRWSPEPLFRNWPTLRRSNSAAPATPDCHIGTEKSGKNPEMNRKNLPKWQANFPESSRLRQENRKEPEIIGNARRRGSADDFAVEKCPF